MKEYALIFRMDILSREAQPTPEQMKAYMQQWMNWINGISDKGQLVAGGNHFKYSGKVIRPKNKISDKPYVSNKESIAGYILITAKNMSGAMAIAKKCPILNGAGTSVEVRETAAPM
jgi:hypothetical protein